MQDAPHSGPSGDGPPSGRRRSRGGRGRRGGRGGYDDRGPPPLPTPLPTPPGTGSVAQDSQDSGRRRPVPREQIVNPTPIPGRLRSDAEEGLDTILSELDANPPPAAGYPGAVAAPQRERDDRRGDRGPRGGRSADRGGDGGRDGRPYRDAPEPRAAVPNQPQTPAREAPMNTASPATAPARPASDDDFGAGVFEEPAKKPAAAPAKAAAAAPAPVAAPAARPVQPADDDDGFGSGLL